MRDGIERMSDHGLVTDDVWRPLGFEDDLVANYDALHDGVPPWMEESFWGWMRRQFVYQTGSSGYGSGSRSVFNENLVLDIERVCRLRIGPTDNAPSVGMRIVRTALSGVSAELRVADYLLSRDRVTAPDTFDKLLGEAGSAWKVGERAGKRGLVKRVPEGVQRNADAVMASSGAAGVKLARAWERAFGVTPDPTGAYALAVRAVEDAAIPVVVPKQNGASLGHVIGQLASDGDWSLPLTREDPNATTASIVLAQCRAVWRGHHDRHGGSPGAPAVTQEEAETAVSLAVTLVQWFASGMVARR